MQTTRMPNQRQEAKFCAIECDINAEEGMISMQTNACSKQIIRKEILAKRNAMPREIRLEKSNIICKNIIETDAYKQAEAILSYIPVGSEVDTKELIQQCFLDQKMVFVPKVSGKDMNFYRIRSLKECMSGFKGIPEPEECPEKEFFQILGTTPKENTLMIMPGAVFDRDGNRIGYGGGYYDRYLSKDRQDGRGYSGRTMAVAFDFQLVESKRFMPFETDIKPE